MREIGSSVRFLRDKFVPLYSERGYSDKDIRNKEVLALFSCGFVPFLSRQNFVSWCKILQVADLKRLVRMIKGRISLTTSNHQKGLRPQDKPVLIDKLEKEDQDLIRKYYPELFK